jgi:casein kinase II subunit beta
MEENEEIEDFDEEQLKQIEHGNYLDEQDAYIDDDNDNDNENENDNEIEVGFENENENDNQIDNNNIEQNQEKEQVDNKVKKNQEQDHEPDQDLDHDLDQNEEEDSDDDSKSDKRFPEVEQTDWIHWFCRLRCNEYFVEIDENFLKNEENLTGINCKQFLKTLLSEKPKNDELTREVLEDCQEIREIYGLIHKRFILTPLGMGLMREKFLDGLFGYCPRLLCNKQVMLPIGLSEDMRYSQVKVFCPLCQEVYKPRENFYGYGKKIYKFDLPDGIFFGTSFPQAFLANFPDLDPRISPTERYIPKLYGFRIFGKYGSKYYTKDQEELERRLIKYGIKKN